MMTLKRTIRALAGPSLFLALPGCVELIPPNVYLLPPAAEAEAAGEGLEQQLIVVPRIALPAYASDNRIASMVNDVLITQSGDNLWADDPERAATVRLASALSRRTGAPVLAEPWPVETSPTIKIDVLVEHFIGSPGGTVMLSGEFRVADVQRNGLAIVRSYDISAEVPGQDLPALVAAHGAALDLLAEEISNALFERYVGQSS